jgi:hypothetical protein
MKKLTDNSIAIIITIIVVSIAVILSTIAYQNTQRNELEDKIVTMQAEIDQLTTDLGTSDRAFRKFYEENETLFYCIQRIENDNELFNQCLMPYIVFV